MANKLYQLLLKKKAMYTKQWAIPSDNIIINRIGDLCFGSFACNLPKHYSVKQLDGNQWVVLFNTFDDGNIELCYRDGDSEENIIINSVNVLKNGITSW